MRQLTHSFLDNGNNPHIRIIPQEYYETAHTFFREGAGDYVNKPHFPCMTHQLVDI